jgi:hypothetical protein
MFHAALMQNSGINCLQTRGRVLFHYVGLDIGEFYAVFDVCDWTVNQSNGDKKNHFECRKRKEIWGQCSVDLLGFVIGDAV